MNIIDMVDVDYVVEDTAYSISLPVYYKKETNDYWVLYDVNRKNTLSFTSKDKRTLEESMKNTIINYYENLE
jgi:hypothetical protein